MGSSGSADSSSVRTSPKGIANAWRVDRAGGVSRPDSCRTPRIRRSHMIDLMSLSLALSVGQLPEIPPIPPIPPATRPVEVEVLPHIGQPVPPRVEQLPEMIVPMPSVNSLPPRHLLVGQEDPKAAPKKLRSEEHTSE